MRFACVVATDACIELAAAEMLDGDDIERRVPVRALRQRCEGNAVDCWGWRKGSSGFGHVVIDWESGNLTSEDVGIVGLN